MPNMARAAVPEASGSAAGIGVFAWCVFMAVFLFTFVNTQYEAGRIIYPDFVTGFAALPLNSYLPERIVTLNAQDICPGFLLETKV